MKGKYKFLLLALLIAFASCSFTSNISEENDKDKMLIQLITYLLNETHIAPQDINDDFSSRVFDNYIKQLDPYKRYFYKSDIKEYLHNHVNIYRLNNKSEILDFLIEYEQSRKRITIKERNEYLKEVLSMDYLDEETKQKTDFAWGFKTCFSWLKKLKLI